ncbi:MAG: hypothetical protein ACRDPJ_02315, partial [Nocardioidaceae bacterium]
MPKYGHLLPLVAVTALALVATLTTGAPAAEATPSRGCTTMRAADGHEPPCNPALAPSPWAAAHRGSYAQASSPLPGPGPGQRIDVQQIRL